MKTSREKTIVLQPFHIRLGSGFVLLFALIYFFDESGFLAALFPAVLMHELGHIFMILFFGGHPLRLKAALSGLEIDYSGSLSSTQELLTALAGPSFGLLFSLLCARLGSLWGSDYLLMCAGLGFVLNFFNLLPALPLDGGRILGFALCALLGAEKARTALRVSGFAATFSLISCGLYLIAKGFGIALFLAGVWLFILQQNKTCK